MRIVIEIDDAAVNGLTIVGHLGRVAVRNLLIDQVRGYITSGWVMGNLYLSSVKLGRFEVRHGQE